VRQLLSLVVGQVLGQLGELREVDAALLLTALKEDFDGGHAHVVPLPAGARTETAHPCPPASAPSAPGGPPNAGWRSSRRCRRTPSLGSSGSGTSSRSRRRSARRSSG